MLLPLSRPRRADATYLKLLMVIRGQLREPLLVFGEKLTRLTSPANIFVIYFLMSSVSRELTAG